MPPPYRSAATRLHSITPGKLPTPAAGFGAAIFFGQVDLCLSSGKALKKTNSVRVLSNFASVPAPRLWGAPNRNQHGPISPSPFTERGPASWRGGEVCHCHCYCHWLQSLLALRSTLFVFALCALCVFAVQFLFIRANSPASWRGGEVRMARGLRRGQAMLPPARRAVRR